MNEGDDSKFIFRPGIGGIWHNDLQYRHLYNDGFQFCNPVWA